MKKLLIAFLGMAFLMGTATSVRAAGEDEQWPIPNESAWGHHSVIVDDGAEEPSAYSILKMYSGENQYICKSTSEDKCKSAMNGMYQAYLPVCADETDSDCISSFSAIDSKGVTSEAKFNEYIYGEKHPNEFVGDGTLTPLHASDPSIWSLPNNAHAFGDKYLLMVSLANSISRGFDVSPDARFAISLYPISKMATSNTADDVNGFANFPKCVQKVDSSGKSYLGCGSGAQEYGLYRCAAKMIEAATCLLRHAFPSEVRFKVSVRLSREPAAMLHGRLDAPEISISKQGNSTQFTVEAGSVQVPVIYSGGQYDTLPQEIKNYWDKCISENTCGFSTRRATGSDRTNPNMRNVQDYAPSYGDRALSLVSIFAKSVNDKSVAAPSTWNVRTLSRQQMNNSTNCFKSGTGLIGVVTTNSTTYSEGPPKFEDGNLNYRVASMHYLPSGDVFKGNYNLLLRSDVARCLYGFSKAPINASISILASDGSQQVATTVVSERNNWLYLRAAGFTFSSPFIKVKLTQEAPVPTPTASASAEPTTAVAVKSKISITCVKGKVVRKVTSINPKCPSGYKKK